MNKEPLTSKEMLDKVYWRLTSIEKMIPEMQDWAITDLRRWIEEKWQDRDYFENDQTHYGDAVYRGIEDHDEQCLTSHQVYVRIESCLTTLLID